MCESIGRHYRKEERHRFNVGPKLDNESGQRVVHYLKQGVPKKKEKIMENI